MSCREYFLDQPSIVDPALDVAALFTNPQCSPVVVQEHTN